MTKHASTSWRSLKSEEWPEIDRKLWEDAIARGDALEPDGRAAHWAPKTINQVIKGYGQWLGWLAERGELDGNVSPGTRLGDERLADYAGALRNRVAPQTVVSRLTDLSEAVRVMDPAVERSRLRAMISRIKAHARPVRNKKARVHHPRELLRVGLARMDRIHACPEKAPLIEASRFRDGLMIAILASRPLRLANLTAIRIGDHLVRTGEDYLLSFAAGETKGRRPIETNLPSILNPYIDRYLQKYRPLLMRNRTDDALWISVRRTPLSEQAAYCAVIKATTEELAKPVNPHLFRDSLATSIAVDDPAHVRMAATLLGHASLKTTNDHYNQAQMLTAHRKLCRVIRDLTTASGGSRPSHKRHKSNGG